MRYRGSSGGAEVGGSTSNCAAAPAPPPVVFPPLPEIAAVVGGARPFVVLLNGDKWLPGGQFGGVTLRAVEDQALVFDDAQGNTLRRPR